MPGGTILPQPWRFGDATLFECLDTVDAIGTDLSAVLEPRGNAYA